MKTQQLDTPCKHKARISRHVKQLSMNSSILSIPVVESPFVDKEERSVLNDQTKTIRELVFP